MIRKISLLLTFFSMTSLAHHNPITSFQEGTYLGEGSFFTSDGNEGTFSSFATVYNNEWSLAYVKEGNLASYNVTFDFQENGFFEVAVVYYSMNGQSMSFNGDGYCASVQCYLNVTLGDKVFEETITFSNSENRIYRLGSMKKYDESQPVVAWEERMVLMRTNASADEETLPPGFPDEDEDSQPTPSL